MVQGSALAPGQALAVLLLTADLWYGSDGPNSPESPRVFMLRTQDNTPPVFTAGHPVVLASFFTFAHIAFEFDEPGTVYFAVSRADASTVPSVADLLAGRQGTAAPPDSFVTTGQVNITQKLVSESATVGGLTSLTNYTLWAVAEDRYGNVMVEVSARTFATQDDIPPEFLELQVCFAMPGCA